MGSVHEQLRDAVAALLAAELDRLGLLPFLAGGVVAMAVPNRGYVDLPCVMVTYEGTESEMGEGTNLRKDVMYPVLVGLYSHKPADDVPGVEMSLFREVLSGLFSGRRLAGFPAVLWCTYGGATQIYEDASQAFQHLKTAAVVTPVVRRLRQQP